MSACDCLSDVTMEKLVGRIDCVSARGLPLSALESPEDFQRVSHSYLLQWMMHTLCSHRRILLPDTVVYSYYMVYPLLDCTEKRKDD